MTIVMVVVILKLGISVIKYVVFVYKTRARRHCDFHRIFLSVLFTFVRLSYITKRAQLFNAFRAFICV